MEYVPSKFDSSDRRESPWIPDHLKITRDMGCDGVWGSRLDGIDGGRGAKGVCPALRFSGVYMSVSRSKDVFNRNRSERNHAKLTLLRRKTSSMFNSTATWSKVSSGSESIAGDRCLEVVHHFFS